MKIRSILLGMSLAFSFVACAPKDADIEKEVNEKLNTPSVQVTVHEGVATIVGTCDDDAFKKILSVLLKQLKE